MINTIIFDIGNVLVDFCWKKHIASFGFDEETQERVAGATVLSDDWNQYDLGILSTDEILELFVRNDPGVAEEIKQTFSSLKGLLVRYDHSKAWIRELKERGYRVLYLSNFSREAERDCAEELDFIPLTDGGILSYKVKMTKPDKRIYELLTDTYDLVPEECLFLDDTPVNVEAARAHGYRAEVFKGYEDGRRLIDALGR